MNKTLVLLLLPNIDHLEQVEDYVSGCTCQLTKVKAIYKTLYNIQTYRENKTEEMFGHQAITQ
jgi:hypothetical protein